MLYLIRHAHAADAATDAATDAERPLSAKGRHQVRQLAEMLRVSGGFCPREIWHSPLLRARQTAEVLSLALNLGAPLKEVSHLRPDDPPGSIAARLDPFEQPLAIVGHNPHLALLGSLLVAGSADPEIFIMRKASILALEPARGAQAGGWVVSWHLAPDLSD